MQTNVVYERQYLAKTVMKSKLHEAATYYLPTKSSTSGLMCVKLSWTVLQWYVSYKIRNRNASIRMPVNWTILGSTR